VHQLGLVLQLSFVTLKALVPTSKHEKTALKGNTAIWILEIK